VSNPRDTTAARICSLELRAGILVPKQHQNWLWRQRTPCSVPGAPGTPQGAAQEHGLVHQSFRRQRDHDILEIARSRATEQEVLDRTNSRAKKRAWVGAVCVGATRWLTGYLAHAVGVILIAKGLSPGRTGPVPAFKARDAKGRRTSPCRACPQIAANKITYDVAACLIMNLNLCRGNKGPEGLPIIIEETH